MEQKPALDLDHKPTAKSVKAETVGYQSFAQGRNDRLLTSEEYAPLVGTTSASLKQSRYTGVLFGRPAPRFLKMGRAVRYTLSSGIEFRSQFPDYRNTSEIGREPRWIDATSCPLNARPGCRDQRGPQQ
jgi:hypothetical protein